MILRALPAQDPKGTLPYPFKTDFHHGLVARFYSENPYRGCSVAICT
jgi:hypothetical protein